MPRYRYILCATTILWLVSAHGASPQANKQLVSQPPNDAWPTYNGDYSGQRHTGIAQINPANVHELGLAWAFQTGQAAQIKANPILVGSSLYITTPDNVWALDGRTGRPLWHYTYKANNGFHIGQRGVGVYKNSVFFTTPDDHVISLNSADGSVNWDVTLADYKQGYWCTMAPLVIGNHVLVGTSGDMDNLPGMLVSLDPQTGAKQWTFYSTPVATDGTPIEGYTGGEMWMPGTYDPDLNLLFVGTGNPTPVLNGSARPGDNVWTCSIVAINLSNGRLAWGFQPSPHDTHDWDAVETPVLADALFKGKPKKLLMQASRNGYFFVIDRTNGKSLLTIPFVKTNWAVGIDSEGRPIPDANKDPAQDGRLVSPNESGATNFRSPSFDPKLGLFVVSAQEGYGIFFFKPEHGSYGWAGADYNVWSQAVIKAIDYQTGKVRWTHEVGSGTPRAAGVLTTVTGITFTADTVGNALALRTSDGATLWHSHIGLVGNSPITYELDDEQYVVLAGDSALYAWKLPEKGRNPAAGRPSANR